MILVRVVHVLLLLLQGSHHLLVLLNLGLQVLLLLLTGLFPNRLQLVLQGLSLLPVFFRLKELLSIVDRFNFLKFLALALVISLLICSMSSLHTTRCCRPVHSSNTTTNSRVPVIHVLGGLLLVGGRSEPV